MFPVILIFFEATICVPSFSQYSIVLSWIILSSEFPTYDDGTGDKELDGVYIAEKIDRKVKLKEPDWIIYIKVLRVFRYQEVAAITVTPIEYILSIVKLRLK